MLMLNFKRHYLSNRAPFNLRFRASWFQNPMHLYAFNVSRSEIIVALSVRRSESRLMRLCVYAFMNQRFVDDLLRLDDVFLVTSHQVVEWMRRPTPLNETNDFVPWQCKDRHLEPSEMACELPNSCKLFSKVLQSYRYLHTCFECPKQYPWLRNEFGVE